MGAQINTGILFRQGIGVQLHLHLSPSYSRERTEEPNGADANDVLASAYSNRTPPTSEHPMGDSNSCRFSPTFNDSIRVEGRPERLTYHAGLMLMRELDEKLNVTRDLASKLTDARDPGRIQHSLSQMLRTSTYAMAIDSAHASEATPNVMPIETERFGGQARA